MSHNEENRFYQVNGKRQSKNHKRNRGYGYHLHENLQIFSERCDIRRNCLFNFNLTACHLQVYNSSDVTERRKPIANHERRENTQDMHSPLVLRMRCYYRSHVTAKC
jgi:hypothetical protein